MASSTSSRAYRKVARARQEEETRRRITEAAVELHRTLGPANTTVTELAEAAGVSRTTVYNHFPTDLELFEACSTHWAARNPLPDPETWAGIASPHARLFRALADLYAWYARNEDMLGKVFRDVAIVPALATVMEDRWSSYVDSLVATLANGWPSRDARALDAALRLGVSFDTWQTLTSSGLSDDRAAELASGLVAAGFGG